MLKMLKSAVAALIYALVATAAIASTPTANYGWAKPTVGADANAWGTDLNGDLDGIDSIVHGISGVANAACPMAGCTFTGGIGGTTASFSQQIGVATSSANAPFILNNPGGYQSIIYFEEGGVIKYQEGLQTDNTTWFIYDASNGKYAFTAGTGGVGVGEDGNLTLPPTGGAIVNGGFTLDNGPFSVPAGAISGSEIAAGAIGNSQLQSGAVQSGNLAAGAAAGNLANGSVVNAMLDTVNGSPGTCTATATTSCGVTVNAQGRVTSTNSAAIHPDSCSTNSNGSYCINAEGYMHQAGLSASIGANSTGTVNLPGSCGTMVDSVQATSTLGGTNGVSVTGWTGTQITLRNNQGSAQQIFWSLDCH